MLHAHPSCVARLAHLLSSHPDPDFSSYVVHGMRFGFNIGFSYDYSPKTVTAPNHPSYLSNSTVVAAHLHSCVTAGETAGPFQSPPFRIMHISGLGSVPKKNGKLRIIHDLSSPVGFSVNDGIHKDEFPLHYSTVDTAVASVMTVGQGAYLTKIDIRNAFRLCPVRPEDWHLLGIEWCGAYYFEKVLPFGLRSSPYIFNTFAESLEYLLRVVTHLEHVQHYLDDFLIVSVPDLSVARQQRSLALDLFQYLHVPIAEEKVDGPATTLTFLQSVHK